MKIAELVKFSTPSTTFEVYPDGSESAALFYGGEKVLSIGRVRFGNFDESLGLAEKLRRHLANDALLAEADSVTVIPFGCEYRVARHWNFSGDIVELTDDIAADNGGTVRELDLEDITFTFTPKKVEILLCGENTFRTYPVAEGVIYDGSTLPVAVKVTSAEGFAAEFYCGDDFWRHNGAQAYEGASARHTIEVKDGAVRWVRQVLSIPEEVACEKRPWRFKALCAVGKTEESAALSADDTLKISGCFAAPAAHRNLRSFIRKSSGKSLRLELSASLFCEDGSHIARPNKKILHGILGELFDEYLWAASVTARREGVFTIGCDIPELKDSVIVRNLSAAPEIIEEEEDCGL